MCGNPLPDNPGHEMASEVEGWPKWAVGMKRPGPVCLAIFFVLVFGEQREALTQAGSRLIISTHARAIQPGEVVRLEVRCTCTPSQRPGTARAFDREIPLAPTKDRAGWSGLIGLDVDTPPGSYSVSIVVARLNAPPLMGSYTLIVARKRFPTRQLRVAPVYVDPPPAEVKRILAEAKRLDAIFNTTTWRERVGPFQAPVSAAAGNTFGARSIFNGQARNPHAGVDFGSPVGTPVEAPAAGVVALADDLFFTGGTVVLNHGRGLYSALAHLSTIAVANGDIVERGEVVGVVGATGRVTGPHLHWGTRLNGARVDALSLLEVLAPEP